MDWPKRTESQPQVTLEDHKDFLQKALQKLRADIGQLLLLRRRVARLTYELTVSNRNDVLTFKQICADEIENCGEHNPKKPGLDAAFVTEYFHSRSGDE